jgi:hypothetical protein
MTTPKDFKGQTFGNLTIIEEIPSPPKKRTVRALCSCNGEITTSLYNITRGRTTHCGCLTSTKHPNSTHGESKTPLYKVWASMKQRCYDPNHAYYPDYGGRGITVCAPWQGYEAFRDWAITSGYSPDLTIDRKDVNGDYCPVNCRWVSRTIQAINRRKRKHTASRYVGVSKWSAKGKTGWQARISVDGKNIYLGTYDSELEAAQVRENYIDAHGLKNFTRNKLF